MKQNAFGKYVERLAPLQAVRDVLHQQDKSGGTA
jgi:hypothetical protein